MHFSCFCLFKWRCNNDYLWQTKTKNFWRCKLRRHHGWKSCRNTGIFNSGNVRHYGWLLHSSAFCRRQCKFGNSRQHRNWWNRHKTCVEGQKNDIFMHGYFELQLEGRGENGYVFQTQIVTLYADESIPIEDKEYLNPNSETLKLREETQKLLDETKLCRTEIDKTKS